jgi:anthranilate/para-aminobenzoate synthase component I
MVKITFQKSSNYYNLEILLLTKFRKKGEGFSNLTDEEFKHNVALAKNIVFVVMYFNWFYHEGLPSFKGDEFNVYRALRSINPSPFILIMVISKYLALHQKRKLLSKIVG